MLTSAQEAVLEQIIEAFQNGKRLIDLPDVEGTNPYDLLVEVCENGESKKAVLASMLPYVEQEAAYGIEFDTSVSSSTCTRIGSSDLHKLVPIQNRMKGCLLDDNGNVVEYLMPQDWTGQVRDGSAGQVMVEIPAHYRKFVTMGTKRQVWMSEVPLPGYHLVPKMYVSAYEATIDRTNNKLASVVNLTAQYRGGNNQSDWDGTYKTELGRPATHKSLTEFRTLARARKSGSTEWNCMTYDVQKALYWLFAVEYATLNTQAAYNAQLDANGYHQGGLGAGVTNATDWGTFDGSEPFVPCGHTDSLGNGTGQVEYTATDTADNITEDVYVPRYRGVENPFGHIWQWTDGILVQVHPASGENVSKVFVCSDPSKFASDSVANYTHVGNEERAGGFIKEIIFGEGGEIMPTLAGGSDSTYFRDYHYVDVNVSAITLRGVLFGGNANYGSKAGFAYSGSHSAPSYPNANIGSRLCFIPATA